MEMKTSDRGGGPKAMGEKLMQEVAELANKTKKVGKDDPRRIVHSLKVALAITIVSLFYYFEPLYDNFGASSIWAIITVIVVFEFSVGTTLGKGLNRGMATSIGGALGFGAHYIASFSGKIAHPVLLGIFICIIAAATTYFRFVPKLKARYDYGLLIFMLTFSMVTVSSFRDDEILKLAWHRLINILIGGLVAVVICIFVRPVWAGSDLHQMVATNIENLGTFFEGFGVDYFGASQGESVGGANTNMLKYRSVLSSKQNEESLMPVEMKTQYQEHCLQLCTESGKALKAMAMAIRDITPPTTAESHIEKANKTTEELKTLLTSSHFNGGMEMVLATTLIILLIDSFSCSQKIADSVHELVSLARLKTVAPPQSDVAPVEHQSLSHAADHHVITINHTQQSAE
ncbi:aluminum-activated malate transporter 2-like [Momordica charantia]|uniref:Aluminum-activated malate transporter 2-like n=1 Tax=Momordica charantia TaxID=3673 RepID=A0A6J1DGA3_MOMCH|nr:aluminum-activated malate transporter 2-like [Momordica charantia]